MRIVVNDIAASKTGALSVLLDFYHYLAENDQKNEWIFLLSDHYLEERDNISVRTIPEVKKGWLHRLQFDLFTGKKVIEGLQPDLYFSMQNTLVSGYRGKQALYVHQPLGFQNMKRFSFFRKKEREYAVYQHLIGRLINRSILRADLTIVQTDWMREAVLKKTKIAADRIVKITPTVTLLETTLSPASYSCRDFFFPSGEMLYKNHALLYSAVGVLLRAGIHDFRIHVTLEREALFRMLPQPADEAILSHFNCMGSLDRQAVFDRYAKNVLVFPSYIETFGYPPAEAAGVGSLILASDCPFCREVLDGYNNAYYFDPFDADALAGLMKDAIDGKLFQTVAGRSYDRTNSWKVLADALLAVAKAEEPQTK